jgi:GntR family transcriptional regulator
LPTVRELAALLRINPNTVARAYDQLNGDNVISTQQGRGTYVRDRPDDEHLAKMRQEQLKTMMDSAISKALSMGYSCDQVRGTFDACLEHWQDAQNISG